MPQFRYRALDSTGRQVEGAVDAHDANGAVQQLSRQGLRIQSIDEGVQLVHQHVRQRPQTAAVRINAVSDPTSLASGGVHFTKRSSDSELNLLFAQIANLLRSGISPAETLVTLANRNVQDKFSGPLRHMARMTAEGTAMSEAMECFPDLFPPGVVGSVRSGERGGYLPEACEVVSNQREESKKLAVLFKWPLYLLAFTIPGIGFVFALGEGIERGIDSFDSDPSGSGNAVFDGILGAIFGPVGIVLVLMLLGTLIFRMRWMHRDNTFKRHDFSLKVPIFGHRAKNECLSIFSWNLNMLAKAGLSPYASWQGAADAVPNVAFAQRLKGAGSAMSENTKFSELFYSSDIFPQEVAATVESGEVSGNIAASLEHSMQLTRDRQKAQDMLLKFKAGCWVLLLWVGGTLIGMAVFYSYYFKNLFRIIEP